MTPVLVNKTDVVGLAKPEVDIHTLGVSAFAELLSDCGVATEICGNDLAAAFGNPQSFENADKIVHWIKAKGITVLGVSYRLDVNDAALIFSRLMYQLETKGLIGRPDSQLKRVCFAGLPGACKKIIAQYNGEVPVFFGDETPVESLRTLGLDPKLIPTSVSFEHPYDAFLERFGTDVIKSGKHHLFPPIDRSRTRDFGTESELLTNRIDDARKNKLPPILRAHAGPYLPNRELAIEEFVQWAKRLAASRYLDVLSIGTSQLSQERFGEDWQGRPDGGGVPINSAAEFRRVYEAARPMLVRTYAGTTNIPQLAKMYQDTINISWHALSVWWFSAIDGRGPYDLLKNLEQHFATIKYIATTGKPWEANVPHHFAFRGSDDVSYVVSGYLSARIAKQLGIRTFVLQNMLNDPKYTWGVMDLAKSRAMLELVKSLEDDKFKVVLQTRAGLDYLSHDLERAKRQLASVTALMDDIDPENVHSPDIIHVVSYSEGVSLATPEIIDESCKITCQALAEYRALRKAGLGYQFGVDEISERQRELVASAEVVLKTIEACVKSPYSPQGFFDIFRIGFLPVPQLRYCRELFPEAIRWATKVRDGRVDVYEDGKKLPVTERMRFIREEVAPRS